MALEKYKCFENLFFILIFLIAYDSGKKKVLMNIIRLGQESR